MRSDFLGKRWLVVTAHPDDEAYAAGGALYANSRKGGTNFLVCASLGEKGSSHMKEKVTVGQMKRIRKAELLKCCNTLGIRDLVLAHLPDGRVSQNKQKLLNLCLKAAFQSRPETVLGFGPDGITGHKDHIAAGEVARRVAKKLRVPFYCFSLPPSFASVAKKFLTRRRKSGRYVRHKDWLKFGKPSIIIPISKRVKMKAIMCHKSQLDGKEAFSGLPKAAVSAWLEKEYFCHGHC